MRRSITDAQYTAHIEGDMGECFEMFLQQTAYFEVLHNLETPVARLGRFSSDLGYFNASFMFPTEGSEEITFNDDPRIAWEYFAYDTIDEAKAHGLELLIEADIAIA